MTAKKKFFFQKGMIILFWLCVWQIVSAMMHNNILLVGPLQVGKAFIENISGADFIRIILYSFCRIGLGFLSAFFAGLLLGTISYRYAAAEMLLAPVITVLKSVPVASFAVLLLIWAGSSWLSFFISFFIVFPNVYVNTTAGLKSVDRQLLEMAQVFGVSKRNCFYYLYRPALMPYLISCLKISLGMSWKSGVAAEVIGLSDHSLGERIYMSKIYLDTAGLFAWTLTVIFVSFLFEKAVLYLIRRYAQWAPCPAQDGRIKAAAAKRQKHTDDGGGESIRIRNLEKSYNGQQVLRNFSLTMECGGRYCLMAPSGAGKTTLLRLINRTQHADSGTIEGVPAHVGMVFQEDRLCESYDVLTNIMLTAKSENVREEALRILPEECLTRPVSELSGGMRRRCAVLRAMLSESDMLIMDEPFTGLDGENREKTAAYILEKLQGRTLLITTHRKEDAALLDAVRIALTN